MITSSSQSDLHWHLLGPYANTPPRTLREDDTDMEMAGAGQGQPQNTSLKHAAIGRADRGVETHA
jgi:hypothetical protein